MARIFRRIFTLSSFGSEFIISPSFFLLFLRFITSLLFFFFLLAHVFSLLTPLYLHLSLSLSRLYPCISLYQSLYTYSLSFSLPSFFLSVSLSLHISLSFSLSHDSHDVYFSTGKHEAVPVWRPVLCKGDDAVSHLPWTFIARSGLYCPRWKGTHGIMGAAGEGQCHGGNRSATPPTSR